ncbi:MAG TPA: pentapeptide repeat-containing protein, partial [Cyanobacteria bacterium UBA8553]|nr:pentapeptide repeat-containing protein [Cyanobacteria bacterium UBA8553]
MTNEEFRLEVQNLIRQILGAKTQDFSHLAKVAHLSLAEDFTGVDLSSEDLSGDNLNGADLSLANLNGADLSGADLSSANLSGA